MVAPYSEKNKARVEYWKNKQVDTKVVRIDTIVVPEYNDYN